MKRIFLSLSLFLFFNLQSAVFANVYIREYETPEKFVARIFTTTPPKQSALWLTSNLKEEIQRDFDYQIRGLRVKYWENNGRTAWILDEIGKESPITVGIHVKEKQIAQTKVLIYRESRGDEVRHDFFTDQFKAAKLNKDLTLDRHIDGITGATLSVRALTKLSRIALWLDSRVTRS